MITASDFQDEFFASDIHNATARKCRDLMSILSDNPIYASNQRIIALAGDQEGQTAPLIGNLARLTGAGGAVFYPKEKIDELCDDLSQMGLMPDQWDQCGGGEDVYLKAKQLLLDVPLPPDLTVVKLSKQSARDFVQAVAEMSMDCGVTPLPGAAMRGQGIQGLILAATDSTGEPVAASGSFLTFHPDNVRHTKAFWGMLATREDRRGEKIALVLGAMAVIDMWENKGARGFFTGIRSDNAVSKAVCAKMGVVETEYCLVVGADPAHFGDTPMTK